MTAIKRYAVIVICGFILGITIVEFVEHFSHPSDQSKCSSHGGTWYGYDYYGDPMCVKGTQLVPT